MLLINCSSYCDARLESYYFFKKSPQANSSQFFFFNQSQNSVHLPIFYTLCKQQSTLIDNSPLVHQTQLRPQLIATSLAKRANLCALPRSNSSRSKKESHSWTMSMQNLPKQSTDIATSLSPQHLHV